MSLDDPCEEPLLQLVLVVGTLVVVVLLGLVVSLVDVVIIVVGSPWSLLLLEQLSSPDIVGVDVNDDDFDDDFDDDDDDDDDVDDDGDGDSDDSDDATEHFRM